MIHLLAALTGSTAGTGSSQEVVSDSGAESCSEEARRRTAEAFMTGIMSSITGPALPSPGHPGGDQETEGEDIVSEVGGSYSVTSLWPEVTPVTGLTNHIVFAPQVDNVLTKLMASLQRGLLLCSSLTIHL